MIAHNLNINSVDPFLQKYASSLRGGGFITGRADESGSGPIRSNKTVCHDLRRQEYIGFIGREDKKVAAIKRYANAQEISANAREGVCRLLEIIAD